MTYDEDRLHGWMIEGGLCRLRNGAIMLLRRLDDRFHS